MAISLSEILTRYIFSRDHFSPTIGRVKYAAFLPNIEKKTSVFRISGLNESEILDIGKNFVAVKRNKTLRARGDISTSKVLVKGLNVQPDTKEHARHANIMGWPQDKSKQKLVAVSLADKAELHVY
jgi:hypothetical protein